MTPSQKENLLKLLSSWKTYSPKEKYEKMNEYFYAEMANNTFSNEDMNAILTPLLNDKQKRSENGRKYAERTVFTLPVFKAKYEGYGPCNTCKGHISEGSPCFFIKQVGAVWTMWHPLPECFPEEWRVSMEHNKNYCKWKMP